MKRALLLIVVLLGGVIVVRRLLPAEWRERLAGLPGSLMGRMMEHMPEN
jgi:hypothetical protein